MIEEGHWIVLFLLSSTPSRDISRRDWNWLVLYHMTENLAIPFGPRVPGGWTDLKDQEFPQSAEKGPRRALLKAMGSTTKGLFPNLIPNLVTLSTDQVRLPGITDIGICEYEALQNVRRKPSYFIEEVYHPKLPHSSPGHLVVNKLEKMFPHNFFIYPCIVVYIC